MKKELSVYALSLLMLAGCSSVPLTGRKQLLLVSDQEVLSSSLTQYKDYIKSAQKSTNATQTAMVVRVGKNIAAATERYLRSNGLSDEIKEFAWEFNLVKSDEINAFCMPGGKIVVYEGLMKLVSSDDELAVVLGHEVAHAVAKHSNERISQQMLTQYGAQILGQTLSQKSEMVQAIAGTVYGVGAQYGVTLPFSRKHETEADYMGLILMTMAGYNPDKAVTFWQKMSASSGGKVPEFMTHTPVMHAVSVTSRKNFRPLKLNTANKTFIKKTSMKKVAILLLIVSLLSSGCGTTQPERTDAIVGGAAIGNSVGGAIGGLVGDSRHGWRGSYRGSAIGSIVGTLAGAAIGGALTAPKSREENRTNYPVEQVYAEPDYTQSALSSLYIRNIRFIDNDRDHVISSGESSKIIFEIMNEGNEIAYNVIPSVAEISGMKHLHISPSILVEQIQPGNGVKYTATVTAGKRIKTGTATFRLAVTDTRGQMYDQKEFTLNTAR